MLTAIIERYERGERIGTPSEILTQATFDIGIATGIALRYIRAVQGTELGNARGEK
jgi:hypothetical protein